MQATWVDEVTQARQQRDAAIAERDALARAVSLVEGTLKAEMDAHRRTISERDAGARHSQVVDNTHAEWVIDQWDRVGRSIMKVATGRDAVLSDSDVEGEIIRLRAALTEARWVLREVLPVDCEHVHHPKRDQHPSDAACPVLQRAAAVLAQEEK